MGKHKKKKKVTKKKGKGEVTYEKKTGRPVYGFKRCAAQPVEKAKISKYGRLQAGEPHPTLSTEPVESQTDVQELEERVATKFHRKRVQQEKNRFYLAARQAAHSEGLLTEQAGFIRSFLDVTPKEKEKEQEDDSDSDSDDDAANLPNFEENEQEVSAVEQDTSTLKQSEIAASVDISSAAKHFDLDLAQFGPYRMRYTRSGRHLLLAGRRGHVAAIDWPTKKLMCEFNAMESTADISWLHNELMFAVAQARWTYIYDRQGIELHCLKTLDRTMCLEFLPYHFLLVASTERGYLDYLDVSVGEIVVKHATGLGPLGVMAQNPANAIIHLGHPAGTVSLWSPNEREPLAKILCHRSCVRSLAVDCTGRYQATSGVDRKLRIWDLRTYKLLQSYRLQAGAGSLSFSQRGLLAASMPNQQVQVFQEGRADKIYLQHRLKSPGVQVQFCPYEDVLGVSHERGFTSLLVPGAGEPNFDALEENPFQTRKQRQEMEVKRLLEKIPADMITLDSRVLRSIDRKHISAWCFVNT